MALNLSDVRRLERELGEADLQIDYIIRNYYAAPGGQNIGGNIGEISKKHAELVELLAEKKRELMEKKK